ncbi:hypothetical protein GPU17_04715 [Streptococcus thermophilus]|nr:hypothetical protein [Streptococcus thermophilus]MCE2064871.1 hypothetical protein [Streptococcus thermophilus]MCE2069433.1 hypothetical protein [Streptococcus thermophilus]MCE2079639.1 hypothetical protein [Streptococcus thermophilus]MCE2081456.1 hypothetical protein [Streptococcus thermophilus]
MRLIKNITELIGIKDQNIIIFSLFLSFIFLKITFYTIRKQTDKEISNKHLL